MHGVRRSAYFVYQASTLALQRVFVFRMNVWTDGRTYGRKDTMCENNDHLLAVAQWVILNSPDLFQSYFKENQLKVLCNLYYFFVLCISVIPQKKATQNFTYSSTSQKTVPFLVANALMNEYALSSAIVIKSHITGFSYVICF